MNPGNKKKLTAAGVGWGEYEDADEWHGAGATRNKEKMRLLGREHKGTTRSAKQRETVNGITETGEVWAHSKIVRSI